MKKYFLHNGNEQQGPFDIEDLKDKNITKQTSVWYEGMSDWTEAGNIEGLNDLFKTATPPPFQEKKIVPPPIAKTTSQPIVGTKKTIKKKSYSWLYITFAIIVIIIIALSVVDIDSSSQGSNDRTYQEKVMTVEQIELSQPTSFLTAAGKYNENFWGDKINVHGVITNKATVATYKDAVVKVTYYSKTNTEIGSKEYTIYEIFTPHSSTNFELKIDNYKDVSTIGWDVISATPGI